MQQELHLRDIFKILRKHRLAIGLTFVGILAVAAAVNLLTTPQYEATTKLVIERSEPNNLTDHSQNIQRDPEFYETQYQLIRSRAVARRVVERLAEEQKEMMDHLLVEDRRSRAGGWIGEAKSLLGWQKEAEESEPTDLHERLSRVISEGIRVRPVEGSRLVQISFLATDPRFASQVVNTVVDSYRAEVSQMKMETTKQVLDWMNRKADSESQKLKASEDQLQRYMGDNNVLTLENRIAILPEKLSSLSGELIAAEARRKELQSLNAKVSGAATDPGAAESVAAVLSDAALQGLRAEIVAAERQVLELSGKYGPKHPVMQKAKGNVEILQRKKQQEISRIVRSIRNEYELALANEKNLRAQLEETRTEALKMNEKFMKVQSLQTEVDTNRKLFDALIIKMKEEGITSESQSVKMWVVEAAGLPTAAARPRKALNLALGGVLGLLGGLGLAFFREYLDNTIRNPDEAEMIFRTPVLGTVSLCRKKIEKIVLDEPLSAFSESYKSLRTTLMVDGSLPQKILVTSSLPGEGKTSTSVNLALAFAQTDLKVILVDADLRKPRVHEIFRLPNRLGLSRLLRGEVNERLLAEALQPGPLENLRILAAGPVPPNPSELLMTERMKQVLKLLEKECDILICDSPPVLAVEDSRILGRRFHGTILIARAHRTDYEVVGRALKLLKQAKTPVFGFLVNGLDQKKSEHYYHSQYYTSYREDPLKLEEPS